MPGVMVEQYDSALWDQEYARAYRFLDGSLATSLSPQQFTDMTRSCDAVYGAVSTYSVAPDLATTTTPLPGEPLPEVSFTRNPAENLIVTVGRTHVPSYLVRL